MNFLNPTTYTDNNYILSCDTFPIGFGFEFNNSAAQFEITNIKPTSKYINEVCVGDVLVKINEVIIDGMDKYDVIDVLKEQVRICKESQTSLRLSLFKGEKHMLRDLHVMYVQKQNNASLINNVSNKYEALMNHPEHVSNVHQTSYTMSSLNPLKRDTVKTLLNIDTLFAKSRNLQTFKTNDFVYELPQTLTNIISLKMSSIEIPNIWYNISKEAGNNSFYVEVRKYNDGEGNYLDNSHVIIIPDGNYTSSNMVEFVNNYFFNIKKGLDFIFFEINPLTGKTMMRAFDINDNISAAFPKPYDPTNKFYSPDLEIIMRFNMFDGVFFEPDEVENGYMKLQQTLGWYMGYDYYWVHAMPSDTQEDPYTYTTGDTILHHNIIQSQRYFSNSLKRYFYVEVNDFQNNFKETVVANLGNFSGSIGRNIIARIPITSGSNTILMGNNSDYIYKQRDYFGPVNIQKLHIRLLDNFGRPLPLNDNDFSMTLEMEQIYS